MNSGGNVDIPKLITEDGHRKGQRILFQYREE